jgi:hypothetical protein
MSYIKIQLTLATSEESIELYKDYEVHVRVTHSIPSESSNHKNNSRKFLMHGLKIAEVGTSKL